MSARIRRLHFYFIRKEFSVSGKIKAKKTKKGLTKLSLGIQ